MNKKRNIIPSIGVLGDLMLDEYWFGDVNRISPEAPVPILEVTNVEYRPGGAANVAYNLCHFNCKVYLFSAIGADDNQKILFNLFKDKKNFKNKVITSQDRVTSRKIRLIGAENQIVRADFEKNSDSDKKVLKTLEKSISELDALIISDYGKGIVNELTIKEINKLKLKLNPELKIFVDPNPKLDSYKRYKDVFFITPNLSEYEKVVGNCKDTDEIISKARNLNKSTGISNLLVTLGKDGMIFFPKNKKYKKFKALAKEVFDVSGAGDTVISALTYFSCINDNLDQSVDLANKAAAIVVSKVGTATTSEKEVTSFEQYHRKTETISLTNLIKKIKTHKNDNKTIVMTNGCFDLLHPGHVDYLKKANKLGQVFIIAINTDNSVKALKGNSRPINNLKYRTEMLESLEIADYVVSFDEETPLSLIKKIEPDILVKGGDYKKEDIVGYNFMKSYGGIIKTIPFVFEYSSSQLVQKIKEGK